MTITENHVYVLTVDGYRTDEAMRVRLFADALDAIIAARPLCNPRRTHELTDDDYGDGVMFRGWTVDEAAVTVTRQLIV